MCIKRAHTAAIAWPMVYPCGAPQERALQRLNHAEDTPCIIERSAKLSVLIRDRNRSRHAADEPRMRNMGNPVHRPAEFPANAGV